MEVSSSPEVLGAEWELRFYRPASGWVCCHQEGSIRCKDGHLVQKTGFPSEKKVKKY